MYNLIKILILFLLIGLILINIGCSKSTTNPKVNTTPPNTHLFIDDAPDTVSYYQVLHWWGDDVDGWIVGYEYHWDDDDWTFTTAQSDTFDSLLAPRDSLVEHTFYVRAKDNDGVYDPTPVEMTFKMRNRPPTVAFDIECPPLNITFGTVSFFWYVNDPEGVSTISSINIRVVNPSAKWEHNTTLSASATSYTVPDIPADTTTIYIWAIDSGGAIGDTLSYTWTVKSYIGNMLLVDDCVTPSIDNFYQTNIANNITEDYTYWDYMNNAPYVVEDVLGVLNHFDVVIWYTDNRPTNPDDESDLTKHLGENESAFASYLENSEHRLFITSNIAIGETGGFLSVERENSFLSSYIDTVFVTDLTLPFTTFVGNDVLGYDDLKSAFATGVEIFKAADNCAVIYNLPDGNYGGYEGEPDLALRYPASGDPNFIFMSFPLSDINGNNNALNMLLHILNDELDVH